MKKRFMLLALAVVFGLTAVCYANDACKGDLNCDGNVDGFDLATFAMDFGRADCAPACLGVEVITPCTCEEDASNIQQALNALPAAGGTVYLKAGYFMLAKGIHINRSNVTIIGEQGTLLRLDDHVNQPVILIGTDIVSPGINDTIKNIRIAGLEIDGNRVNQDSEEDPQRTWIRNNGIDIRAVENLWVENVNIHDARSGGIVASWKSRSIFITNSSFYQNQIDGIALYDSEDIVVSNMLAYDNIDGAGISIDNKLKQVSFNGGTIKNNGTHGVFARDSEDNNFHDLMIYGNSGDGVYLHHKSPASDTGVKRFFFQGCSIYDNSGYGFWLRAPASDSPNNTIIGCVFENNTLGCIKEDPGAYLYQAANLCR